jgi:formylglycine-generating enzyme required for sulfatase activity
LDNECVDCDAAADCPQAGRNPCALAKCDNGECSFVVHPSTTECAGGGHCSQTEVGVCERAPVNAGGVSIDATEVTRGQYHQFVLAMVGSTPSQPAACAFNDDITPKYDEPPAMEDYDIPVTFVDWCDAWAYCAWAGRRLCGKVGGGSNATSDLADPTRSQWMRACTGPSSYAYPYGNSFEPTACVSEPPNPNEGKPAEVAYYSGCEGGYPNLYDMSGNVAEWEDSCTDMTGPDDTCRVRGGGYAGFGPDNVHLGMRCDNAQWSDRSQRQQMFGFRCCGP